MHAFRKSMNGGVGRDGTFTLKDEVNCCVECKQPANLVCTRCSDYYCSIECQKKDWHTHRYICFAMPELQLATEYFKQTFSHLPELKSGNSNRHSLPSIEQLSMNDSPSLGTMLAEVGKVQSNTPITPKMEIDQSKSIPDGSVVTLHWFRTTNRVYIRLRSPENDSQYKKILQSIQNYGKIAKPMQKLPLENDFVITTYTNDGTYARGRVVSCGLSTRIFLCEYGKVVTRRLNQLWQITPEVIALPQLLKLVQLRNVSYVNQYPPNFEKIQLRFQDMTFTIRIVEPDIGGGNVELYNSELCVNDELKNLAFATTVAEDDSISVDSLMHTNITRRTRLSNGDENNQKQNAKNKKTPQRYFSKEAQQTMLGKQVSPAIPQAFPSEHPSPQQLTPSSHSSVKQLSSINKLVSPKGPIRARNSDRVLQPPFKFCMFEKGCTDLMVTLLDDSHLSNGYIGVIKQTDLKYLESVMSYFESYQDVAVPYKPILGEFCLAKYENDWYRAQVIDFPDDTHYTVNYIDFTNEGAVTEHDIRSYPTDLKFDCKSNLCLIDGWPSKPSEDQVEKLLSYIRSDTFIIDEVKHQGEKFCLIEMRKVFNKVS